MPYVQFWPAHVACSFACMPDEECLILQFMQMIALCIYVHACAVIAGQQSMKDCKWCRRSAGTWFWSTSMTHAFMKGLYVSGKPGKALTAHGACSVIKTKSSL